MRVMQPSMPKPPTTPEKISLFCNVAFDAVVEEKDVDHSIYEVPLMLQRERLDVAVHLLPVQPAVLRRELGLLDLLAHQAPSGIRRWQRRRRPPPVGAFWTLAVTAG